MLQRVSEKMADYLVDNGTIDAVLVEVYQYGLELFFSCIITNLSVLLIACQIDSFWMGFLYFITSVPLRMTCGGYHAPTYGRCYLISNLSYIIVSLSARFLTAMRISKIVWVLILFGSVVYLYGNAPVKNPNHPVSNTVLKKNKCLATVFLIMDCLILIPLYIWKEQFISVNFVVLTILSVAIFILPTKRKGGKVNGIASDT